MESFYGNSWIHALASLGSTVTRRGKSGWNKTKLRKITICNRFKKC